MMKNKILTIGPVTKDLIITPSTQYYQCGGSVYYQICTLNKLNICADSIITIGKNDLKLLDKFPNKNTIKIIKKSQTIEYTNIYSETMERKQKAILPDNIITPENIMETKLNIKNYTSTILSPLSKNDIPPETIKYLKRNDIQTILLPQGYVRDINENNEVIASPWINFEIYLKNTDIICLDEKEYKLTFNVEEINDKEVQTNAETYNLENIIITKAEKGSTIYTNEKVIHIPSIKTEKIVDSTGLGDTYLAAYITKKLETNSIKTAGLFASICAKYKLETRGPLNTNKYIIEKELKRRLN